MIRTGPRFSPSEAIQIHTPVLKPTPIEVRAAVHSISFGFVLWMLLISAAVIYLVVVVILKGPKDQLGRTARMAIGGIGSAHLFPRAYGNELNCNRTIAITTAVSIGINILVLLCMASAALYLAFKLKKHKAANLKLQKDNMALEQRNKELIQEVLGKLLNTHESTISHPPLYPSLTSA